MVIGHLILGTFVGFVTAIAALIAGMPLLNALGLYVSAALVTSVMLILAQLITPPRAPAPKPQAHLVRQGERNGAL